MITVLIKCIDMYPDVDTERHCNLRKVIRVLRSGRNFTFFITRQLATKPTTDKDCRRSFRRERVRGWFLNLTA